MPSHSQPNHPTQPDDIPAEPDSPSWTRRGFVRTASGLFVASSFGQTLGACKALPTETGPETGTLRVSVTGFHPNATEAGTLSGTVDGQALEIELSPPSAGSSSGEAADVPVGTHEVTHTPPFDHSLGSADLDMATKSVEVSAADGGDVSWDVDPLTETVVVTINGLADAATEAGTISGDVPITLSAPNAATSSGESGQVLLGTYDVTYAPPAAHRLVSADVGLETKRATVLENTGSSLTWGVEAILDVPFHSDWSTALGTSDAAILDTDKAVPWETIRGTGNEVISASGLDFPTTNVFQTTAIFRPGTRGGARATGPSIDSSLTGAIPDVGRSIYYRVYIRIGVPDAYTADVLTHPYQDGPGSEQNWQHQVVTASDGTWTLRFNWVGSPYPNNNWIAPALNKNQTYRVEHRIHRIGATTANLHARVYTSDDVLLYADADFDNSAGTAILASTPTFTFNNINLLSGIRVGLNGLAGGVEGEFPFTFAHYGALAMRTDDWCGAYANGI